MANMGPEDLITLINLGSSLTFFCMNTLTKFLGGGFGKSYSLPIISL